MLCSCCSHLHECAVPNSYKMGIIISLIFQAFMWDWLMSMLEEYKIFHRTRCLIAQNAHTTPYFVTFIQQIDAFSLLCNPISLCPLFLTPSMICSSSLQFLITSFHTHLLEILGVLVPSHPSVLMNFPNC